LDYLEVGHRAKVKPALLSGGEAQRVAIARALANRPRIILADEPTAALDSKRAGLVMDLLRKLAVEQEACIVTVTHDEKIFDRFDRLIHLRDGRLGRRLTPEEPHDRSRPHLADRRRGRRRDLRPGLTVVSGGRAIFGGVDMGAVVPFVLWFNFGGGFAYLLAGIGLWRGTAWAPMLAHRNRRGDGAGLRRLPLARPDAAAPGRARTMGAMILRTGIWTAIATVAAKIRWPR
jgi:energy-coupling factor transporter ATP-binding protein EcfA2